MKESLMSGTLGISSINDAEYRGCCFNLRSLFHYVPATQEQLRAFLFSDYERYSTFIMKEEKLKKKLEERKNRKAEQEKMVKKTLTPNFNGNQQIGAFKIRNSWGEHAGDSGEFYISYDFFQSLVVRLTEVM